MNTKLPLDSLTGSDIKDLLRLTQATGWDFTADEWWTLLVAGRVIGHRNAAGEVISCGGIVPYGPDFAVIGGVITDPSRQKQGLGRQLMDRLLTMMPTDTDVTFSLLATAAGRPLYEKLGFRHAGHLWKAAAQGPLNKPDVTSDWRLTESLPMKDLNALGRLDAERFGRPRGKFIQRRLGQAEARAFLYDSSDTLLGYAMGVTRGERMLIGPVSAPGPDEAAILIQSIASRHEGPLRIDVPDRHASIIEKCEALGFSKEADCLMMVRGEAGIAENWDRYYAVAAQAYL